MSWLDQDQRDAPDFRELSARRIKAARRDYTCALCKQPIPKGSNYFRHVYLLDGVFASEPVHTTTGACIRDEP